MGKGTVYLPSGAKRAHQRLHAPYTARSCRSSRKFRKQAGVGKGAVYLPSGAKRAHQRFLASPTQRI